MLMYYHVLYFYMYLIPFHQVTGLESTDEPELAESLPPSTTDPLFSTTYTLETSTANRDVSLEDDIILPEDREEVLIQQGSKDRMEVAAPEEVTSESMWQRTEVLAGKEGWMELTTLIG